MCGICGIAHLDPRRPVNESTLREMAQAIRHRGPDDEGFLVGPGVGLGHRRLSIVDLAGGHQPLSNEDGSVWVAFNGEIYNHKEIRSRLEARGHVFRTRSDTEAIVHAYEEYGDSFVDHLRGMFAFALWDHPRRRLVLVRDRLGIKPLYYGVHDGTLRFASEAKAILMDPLVERRLDDTHLASYLGLRYTPGGTLLQGIEKLPAGSMLSLEDGTVRVRSYWDLEYEREPIEGGLAAWTKAFEDVLSEAIELRLMSEVPLGAFLSGGLDSSATVGLMSGMVDDPVRTFSVGYEDDPDVSELEYAGLVARHFGTQHRELKIDAQGYWSEIPRLLWHLDEPVADYACLPLMLMSELTREHVTVILSGEGADELLAGYGQYAKAQTIDRLRSVPGASLAARLLGTLLPEGKLRRYAQSSALPLEQRYRGISVGFADEELMRLAPDQQAGVGRLSAFTRDTMRRAGNVHPLHQMLYFDTRVYLVDDLLVKADKMTMAASLELRVPFLDHKLVELAANLPPEAKLGGGTTKRVLRNLGASMLPEPILSRPKRGFPVPLQRWLGGELTDLVRDTVCGSDATLGDLVDLTEVKRLVDRHARGVEDCTSRIWTLVVLDQWKRVFVDPPALVDLGRSARAGLASSPTIRLA